MKKAENSFIRGSIFQQNSPKKLLSKFIGAHEENKRSFEGDIPVIEHVDDINSQNELIRSKSLFIKNQPSENLHAPIEDSPINQE